jgi:uncharacterized RDD family membrane protein YckC
MNGTTYAGFWKRVLAHLIDTLLLGAVELIIFLPMFGLLGLNVFLYESDGMEPSPGMTALLILAIVVGGVTALICTWLYFALMESSAAGATLGKMAIGIKVTDMQGNRLSFWRATGRFFAKYYISGLTFGIGYVMAAFTQQKQALHDILAGCLVVNKQ